MQVSLASKGSLARSTTAHTPRQQASFGASRSSLNRQSPSQCSSNQDQDQCPAGRAELSVQAEGGFDFDSALASLADKFEASPNKIAISGWTAGIASGILFSEWLIHRPLLNILLGFPIQLLGLLTLPYLGVRYYVDKAGKPADDFSSAAKTVIKKLPGLEK